MDGEWEYEVSRKVRVAGAKSSSEAGSAVNTTLFHNARVFTADTDPRSSWAEAMAVQSGTVILPAHLLLRAN